MTPEQAKYLLPFIKAYSEGKTIQVQSEFCSDVWHDLSNPNFTSRMAYRIKPDPIVVKYRRYIWRNEAQNHYVAVLHDAQGDRDTTYVETLSSFVRWIDTDWVTEVV